jgi:hypothetical protein
LRESQLETVNEHKHIKDNAHPMQHAHNVLPSTAGGEKLMGAEREERSEAPDEEKATREKQQRERRPAAVVFCFLFFSPPRPQNHRTNVRPCICMHLALPIVVIEGCDT